MNNEVCYKVLLTVLNCAVCTFDLQPFGSDFLNNVKKSVCSIKDREFAVKLEIKL